jgi:hypothetical protein
MRCWARGGSHHKHIDLENDLHTNYDKKFKGSILSEARNLHAEGLVTIFKSEGRDVIAAVFPSEEVLRVAVPRINAYLRAIDEPPLEPDIREILTGRKSERTAPLSEEELRRYANMHRRARNHYS